VLDSEKIQLEKTWLEQPRLCSVWVHRTVRWCTGQCPVCQAGVWSTSCSWVSTTAYGYKSPDCPVVHRTVFGESSAAKSLLSGTKSTAYGYNLPDCPVSQRSAAQSARDAWPSQRSDGSTGLSGVHRTVSGAPTAPSLQRSAAPE
jgi:hypothetical protein